MSLNSFQLSFFEAEEINKIIPYPYKLEAESNISINFINQMKKANNRSHSTNLSNKVKSRSKISSNTNLSSKKSLDKVKSSQSNEISKNKAGTNNNKSTGLVNNNESERKICEKFYDYIENCEYCNIFYTQKYLDEPCLIDIKNKIKGRKYHYLLDIVMDLRNLCLYYSDKKFNKENNKIFSEKDLLQMTEQIKKLNPKQLIGLVKLIRIQYNDNNDDKYYEINLNDLDINTLNKINYYIKSINKRL